MQPIIGQIKSPLPFPDVANLGTIVRILLGANLLFALGALLRAPTWDAWPEQMMDAASVAEPHLLIELVTLVAIAPWLARLPYRVGVVAVLSLTAVVAVLTDLLLWGIAPQLPSALARHLVFALLVAGALLFYLNLRARALSPAVTEARLAALQARIRPHFLFNSINAVLSLIRSDPLRAERALEDMADLFRVLMSDNRSLVPLVDEIELCRQYLALESLRLGERLRLEWHLNSMPIDALIPPLVLQPLVENAVYHGIEPLTAPGVLSINVFARGSDVHVILRNPFRPDNESHRAGNRMALANIRERLALHFDVEAGLESRVKGDTYEVHIHIPYRTAARDGPLASRGAAAGGARPEPGGIA